jgi:sigma-B regulation protein RsbU (phosphoserine phosphatase)
MLVYLVFIGAAFILYSTATAKNYKRLRLEGIMKTVEFETEKVNKTIAKIERSAIDLANNGLLFYQSQSKEEGETSVLEYLHSFPTAIGGGFWFEPYAYDKDNLRTGIYAFYDKDEVCFDYSDITEYDYHNLNWYRGIIDAVSRPYQVVWIKPYIDDSSYSLMTSAGAGIFDRQGNLIGISIIDWEIEKVIKELSAIKPTKNSFILLSALEEDYVISSTRAKDDAGASIKSIPWDINADSFVLEGITYLRFGRFMDNGWLLSVQIPENEIFSEMEKQNNQFSIIIAFSFIIMLSFAYYLISKLINAPIKRLTSEVAQIGLGNLDIRVEMTSNDELSLLAKAFNKMAADLKESIEAYAIEHAEKERISAELVVATKIQSSMLPCIFPPYPDRTEFDIYALMLPAKEVGGDFYDFYLTDDSNLAVIIADVAGKGIPAALFMVVTKILIKTCSSCKTPKGIFETVNNKLC